MAEVLPPVVIVGLGELGSVFARGLLRLGHPVLPVLRSTPVAAVSEAYPEPAVVLVTVGEDDLPPALGDLPPQWLSRVALVQNELLPAQWESAGVERPTVAVVWFEKKAGREAHDVLPTVLSGPQAELLARCLEVQGITRRLAPEADLLHELVAKNLYILVLNLAGLAVEGTAGDLLTVHRATFDALVGEVIELQRALVGPDAAAQLDSARLLASLETAIASDPAHGLAGRSAPRRLQRNLQHAHRLGIELPTFERLASQHGTAQHGGQPPSRS